VTDGRYVKQRFQLVLMHARPRTSTQPATKEYNQHHPVRPPVSLPLEELSTNSEKWEVLHISYVVFNQEHQWTR